MDERTIKTFNMIKRIQFSKLDEENIPVNYHRVNSDTKNKNFLKVVVNKPWGYEYLMFQNTNVAIWMLYIKKGHSTSMHCHLKKKTSIVLISVNRILIKSQLIKSTGESFLKE